MVKTGKTRTKKSRSRSQKFKKAVLGRPQGAIQKRVQAVGPEKFGIVAVDCAKARSKWMLTDFYGNILTPPTHVEHDRSSFQLAVLTLRLHQATIASRNTVMTRPMTTIWMPSFAQQ